MLKKGLIFLFFFLPVSMFALSQVPYKVTFVGLKDSNTLKAIKSNSVLVRLQDSPPASINALRYRVESDIPDLITIMKSYGYYDAQITSDIQNVYGKIKVFIFLHPGPRYVVGSYKILSADCASELHIPECKKITLDQIGIEIHKPAIAEQLIDGELHLLTQLAKCSYPLASVDKRSYVVDVSEKQVDTEICVDSGPLCRFGPSVILGARDVNPQFLERRIDWKEGQLYDPDLVEETQKRLIESDLFGSVLVSHGEKLDSSGQLPMKIRLTEAKHKTITLGVDYATQDGPGVLLGWAYRNFRHMGELISFEADVNTLAHTGIVTYKKPDFLSFNQDMVWQLEAVREKVRGMYTSNAYRITARLDRRISKSMYFSFGLRDEYIKILRSISNGHFNLLSIPMFFRYDIADSLLNPTNGLSIVYRPVPYKPVIREKDLWMKQRLIGNFYFPVAGGDLLVLAVRVELGSIVGTSLENIPFNKRFLGGSEENLRGYRYKTVSPHDANGDPTGGRGVIYWTLETRFRLTKKIGVVPFTDWGNITLKQYPRLKGKWFKSVGLGLRYFTFFGPLRLDVGVPLNRGKRDPAFRVYVSVGQSF